MSVNGFGHSVAVGIVVNGVLRTLWVGVGAVKTHCAKRKHE